MYRKEGLIGGLFDEAIAEPVNSDDVLRIGWIRFDLLTQPGDMVVNRARYEKKIRGSRAET